MGLFGRIKPKWVESKTLIIIGELKNSRYWNARRFAADALGEIGSVDPELAKESVPIFTKYLVEAEWLLKIRNLAVDNSDFAAELMSAQALGVKSM